MIDKRRTGGDTACCLCIGDRRRQELSHIEEGFHCDEESLEFARRCGLNELDELEGLGRTVATVHLARELNE